VPSDEQTNPIKPPFLHRATSLLAEVTPYHWLVFLGCWLGGIFDGMDSNLFAVMLPNAITELTGSSEKAVISNVGAWITTVFLVGWTLGGVTLGVVGDKLGRVKAMILSILFYSIFTGLAGLSQTWWQLAICRFLTGFGIGGELVSISTLLAETWPERSRALAVGSLITSYNVGVLFSGLITKYIADWRIVFFVGALPALLAIVLRLNMDEPDKWKADKAQQQATPHAVKLPLKELFLPENRRNVWVGAAAFGGLLIGYWVSLAWIPTWIADLQQGSGVGNEKSIATIYQGAAATIGCLLSGVLANAWGRRPTIMVAYIGSFVASAVMFLGLREFSHWVYWMDGALGFFIGISQAVMYIYLPELFKTRIRATAVGFCLNAGRFLTACAAPFLPLVVGWFNGYAEALTFFAGFYLLAVVAAVVGCETKGQVLPD